MDRNESAWRALKGCSPEMLPQLMRGLSLDQIKKCCLKAEEEGNTFLSGYLAGYLASVPDGDASLPSRIRASEVLDAVQKLTEEEYGESEAVKRIGVDEITPEQFQKFFLLRNKPVILTGLIGHWPALQLWQSNDRLVDLAGDADVCVASTPSGRADDVHVIDGVNNGQPVFLEPALESTTLRQLLSRLSNAKQHHDRSAPYLQEQNSNFLRDVYSPLYDDVCLPKRESSLRSGIDFVDAAMKERELDAINLWIGPDRPFLYKREVRSGRFEKGEDGSFSVCLDDVDGTVPWVALRCDRAAAEEEKRLPLIGRARRMEVTIEEGEVLFLPAQWYHAVSQRASSEGRTIALNFWYDMEFDARASLVSFVDSLDAILKKTQR